MTPIYPYCPAPFESTYSQESICEAPGPVCSEPHLMVIEDESRGLSYVGVGQTCMEELHRITPPNYYRSLLRRLQGQTPPAQPRSHTQSPAQSHPFRPQGPGLATPPSAPSNVQPKSLLGELSDFYTFASESVAASAPQLGGQTLVLAAAFPMTSALAGAAALGMAMAVRR